MDICILSADMAYIILACYVEGTRKRGNLNTAVRVSAHVEQIMFSAMIYWLLIGARKWLQGVRNVLLGVRKVLLGVMYVLGRCY